MEAEKRLTEQEWKQRQRKQNRRKTVQVVVALALVAVISVAGTLAYLSRKTGTKTNTFTGSTGLEIGLDEPKWDEDEAKNYTPAQVIYKNPQLYNGSGWTDTDGDQVMDAGEVTVPSKYDYTEYMAMKVEFTNGTKTNITYANLLNVMETISFDTPNWSLSATSADGKSFTTSGVGNSMLGNSLDTAVQNATSLIFLYNTQVGKGEFTQPLFSQIVIRDGLTNPIKQLDGTGDALTGGFPDFNIEISGAAVDQASFQTSGIVDMDAVKSALVGLLTPEP